MGIYDTGLCSEAGGNISLCFHMYILSAVELRWTARSNTICSEGLNGFLLQLLVAIKIEEVVGSKVRNGSACGELRFGSSRTTAVSKPCVEKKVQRYSHPTITGCFSLSSSSNGVCRTTSGSGVHSSTRSSISYPGVSTVPYNYLHKSCSPLRSGPHILVYVSSRTEQEDTL